MAYNFNDMFDMMIYDILLIYNTHRYPWITVLITLTIINNCTMVFSAAGCGRLELSFHVDILETDVHCKLVAKL